MLHPSKMKNKAAIAASIAKAQKFFGDQAQPLASSLKRNILENILLTYCARFTKAADAAVETETTECPACSGSGRFYFQSGKVGRCFRCVGKGHQDDDDRKRNSVWDRHNLKPAPLPDETPVQGGEIKEDKAEALARARAVVVARLQGHEVVVGEYDEDDIPF